MALLWAGMGATQQLTCQLKPQPEDLGRKFLQDKHTGQPRGRSGYTATTYVLPGVSRALCSVLDLFPTILTWLAKSSKSGASTSLNPNMDRAFIRKGLAPRFWSSKSCGASQVFTDKQTGNSAWQVGVQRRRPKGGGTNMRWAPGSVLGRPRGQTPGLA